jgi:hypothetical protein
MTLQITANRQKQNKTPALQKADFENTLNVGSCPLENNWLSAVCTTDSNETATIV